MIKKRNIIILLVIIIVLLAATFFMLKTDEKPTDSAEPAVPEISLDTDSDIIYINDSNTDDLSKINVTIPGESIEFVKQSDGKWLITGIEDASIKNYAIGMLATDLSKLTAQSVIEENATDLTKYGLDSPAYTISGTYGNAIKTYYAGNPTPTADGYYFKDAESGTVYTIYNTRFSSLFSNKESYRDITFVKVNTQALKSISIKKADSEITLNMMESPQMLNGFVFSSWEMTKPSYNTLDDSRMSSMILEKLGAISVVSVASDKGDYGNYGLNNPYATVTMTDMDGKTQTINVSQTDNGQYYATTDNDRTVYLVTGMSFVDVNPFDLVTKFANIESVEDISSVAVISGDEKYELGVYGEEKQKQYKLNGADISQEAGKAYYQAVIGVICSDFCTDAVYSEPEVAVEYTLNDGTVKKVEFVNYNERSYAVYKNGVCSMQVLKKDVNLMLEAFRNPPELPETATPDSESDGAKGNSLKILTVAAIVLAVLLVGSAVVTEVKKRKNK